jgi:hypothetical protein
MEIDHVLPEKLKASESALKTVLTDFGLPSDFELNSFENWLPAHRRCNALKGENILRRTPLIQMWIDRAREKAQAAREACNKYANERKIEQAIGILSTGESRLPGDLLDAVIQHYATANAAPVIVRRQGEDESELRWMEGIPMQYVPPKEVRLGPHLTVIFDEAPKANPTGPFTYTIDRSAKEDLAVESKVLDLLRPESDKA